MPETATKKQVRYIGWWRRDAGSPWHRIVQGDDEAAVLNRLLDCVRGGDKCVLPASTDPNATEQSCYIRSRPR